jgi:hypothetical protein
MFTLTTMLSMPTFQRLKLTEQTISVTGPGGRGAEAWPVFGHQVVSAGRREMNFRNWTGNPLNCFVTTVSWPHLIWQPNLANSSLDPLCCGNSIKTHAQLSQ